MNRQLAILLALVFVSAPGPSAQACRTRNRPLDNLALTTRAKIIVVATPARKPRGWGVRFRVNEVLKGKSALKGKLVSPRMAHRHYYYGPGNTGSFARARPGAFRGPCKAVDFALGRRYVLFLEGGGFVKRAFSRVSEEATTRWVAAVKAYIGVSKARTLKQRRAALEALAQDPHGSTALRADARRILKKLRR